MTLRETLNDVLKEAMRARDKNKVGTMRMILAALKDRDIAARPKGLVGGVDESEIFAMLQSMIKQRQEAIVLYRQGERQDLVDKESEEIRVIESFLPQALSEEEVRDAIDAAIRETGAAGVKDMGKVMAELRGRYVGRMDFAKISGVVRGLLTA
ncbi:Glutamyl-tRNA amidotransferase [Azospirillaceae bacterium]